MSIVRTVSVLAGAAAIVALATAGTATAQSVVQSDRVVYFTFSQPVSLPHIVLPAGKYRFHLLDPDTTRCTVQVSSADRTRTYATLMTIRAQRAQVPNAPEVRFMETAANVPPAIRTWWYPGQKTGWEFIYPRTQALQLARVAKQPVLTTAENVPEPQMKTAPLARVNAAGAQAPAAAEEKPAEAPVMGLAQRGEMTSGQTASKAASPAVAASNTPHADAMATMPSSPVASSTSPRAATQVARAATTRTSLPQTASQTPLVAFIGLLAAAGGTGLWFRRRHTA